MKCWGNYESRKIMNHFIYVQMFLRLVLLIVYVWLERTNIVALYGWKIGLSLLLLGQLMLIQMEERGVLPLWVNVELHRRLLWGTLTDMRQFGISIDMICHVSRISGIMLVLEIVAFILLLLLSVLFTIQKVKGYLKAKMYWHRIEKQ